MSRSTPRSASPFQRFTRTISTSLLTTRGTKREVPRELFTKEDETAPSDALARESDVTVSNKVTPHFEYKGFATFTLVTIFFAIWLAWTFTPEGVLRHLGITYYPSRWWALTLPAYLLMAMLYTYLALSFYNTEVATVPLADLRNIVDESGILANAGGISSDETFEAYSYNDIPMNRALPFTAVSTSGVRDLPIGVANAVLYSSAA